MQNGPLYLSDHQKNWISQIQDGGRPPFWKPLNCHISATVWPNLMKFVTVTRTRPLQRIEFLKIQNGSGRYSEKHKNRDISAAVWPIFTKFGTLVQNGSLNRSDRQKLNFKNPKWQTAAILKTVISPYLQPFDRFWLNLARWCMLVPSAYRKVQIFNFRQSYMTDRRHLL